MGIVIASTLQFLCGLCELCGLGVKPPRRAVRPPFTIRPAMIRPDGTDRSTDRSSYRWERFVRRIVGTYGHTSLRYDVRTPGFRPLRIRTHMTPHVSTRTGRQGIPLSHGSAE